MKLAVKKDPSGSNPLGGFHYMLAPIRLSDQDAAVWELMGYVIVEVPAEDGERLLKEAGAALNHQLEVAHLTEKELATPAAQ